MPNESIFSGGSGDDTFAAGFFFTMVVIACTEDTERLQNLKDLSRYCYRMMMFGEVM